MQDLASAGARWHIVVSIRKFDLRHDGVVQELFAGVPPTAFRDPSFDRVRHVNIPALSAEELAEAARQSEQLRLLISYADVDLQDLLASVFNLRLAGELLGDGRTIADVATVHTQIELLDKYWEHRMLLDAVEGHRREAVLRAVINAMMVGHGARLERAAVPASDAQTLAALLSRGLLVDDGDPAVGASTGDVLAFPHHVLFEYAVERLIFRGPPEALVQRLAAQPDWILDTRPSLVMHAQYLWALNEVRGAFWELAFRLADPRLQLLAVAEVIAPSIAAQYATSLDDFQPVLGALGDGYEPRREVAVRLLRHVMVALNAGADERRPLVGERAGPWAELLERASGTIDHFLAAAVLKPALGWLLDQPELATGKQLADLGRAARRQLETVRPLVATDPLLVSLAIEAVCRTYAAAPEASGALLREHLTAERVAQWGYIELLEMADEVPRLAHVDPLLVEDLYRAAARHQEKRKDQTDISSSRIAPLFSNVAQDYGMVLFRIEKHFRDFFEQAPEHATRAMAAAVNAYAQERRTPESALRRDLRVPSDVFEVAGVSAAFESDLSSIWDQSHANASAPALKMLKTFLDRLERTAADTTATAALERMIRPFLAEAKAAIVWRRLLLAGARYPATLGHTIRSLAWTPVLLRAPETSHEAAQFAAAMYPHLDSGEREAVEHAALALGEDEVGHDPGPGLFARLRVLTALPFDLLVTEDARRLMTESRLSRTTDSAPEPGWPTVRPEADGSETDPYEPFLTPLRQLIERSDVASILSGVEAAVVPALEALREALPPPGAAVDVRTRQAAEAWGYLAQVCERVCALEERTCTSPAGTLLRNLLVEAADHPVPAGPLPTDNLPFTSEVATASGARTFAAKGLLTLVGWPGCADTEVLDRIEHLSEDPVARVRFEVARRVWRLNEPDSERMWRILERVAATERNLEVLRAAIGSLVHLALAQPARSVACVRRIVERVRSYESSHNVRSESMAVLLPAYLLANDADARDLLHEIANDPTRLTDEAGGVPSACRNWLMYGPIDSPDPVADAARRRALGLLTELARTASAQVTSLADRLVPLPPSERPHQEVTRLGHAARILNDIAKQLYFASGVVESESDEVPVTRAQQRRFLEEGTPLLDQLDGVGWPDIAHTLVETLEGLLPLAPRDVFLRIATVVRSGEQRGYQYESLAAGAMVRIVERFVASYRTLLREDGQCREALIAILNAFVRAGWPAAQRLTHRLDELSR